MKVLRSLILTVIAFAMLLPARGAEFDYGLSVTTFPSPREEFTSLSLDGGNPIALHGKPLTLEFDLLNRPDNVFGTIFRLITDKGDNIDLMYTIDKQDRHNPMIVTGEQVSIVPAEIFMDRWTHVSITLDPVTGEVVLDYSGVITTVKDAGTKSARSLRIAFGYCPFEGYQLHDVASVEIRDISLMLGDRPIRKWDLSLHDGTVCLDNLKHRPAIAANPVWLIDRYITWTPTFSADFDMGPSVAFDGGHQFFATTDGTSIVKYDVVSGKQETIEVKGGEYPSNAPDQLICTSGDPCILMAYNLDENVQAFFDWESGRWVGGRAPSSDHSYWNHSSCWDAGTGTLFSFGGYGHYHYNNELVSVHPENPSASRSSILDLITSRYSSATCMVDSLLYIFGGRGNLSSKQELSPRNYYDLYAFNTRTFEIAELWKMEDNPEQGEFVMGENMVYDEADDCFYVLTTLDGYTLIRIGRTDAKYERMSLPIYPDGNAQYAFCNLFRSMETGKLYAGIVRCRVDGSASLKVMEMNYPPIPVSTLIQSEENLPARSVPVWLVVLLCSLSAILVGCGIGFLIYKRRAARAAAAMFSDDGSVESSHFDFSRSSICFFGGFKVKDSSGMDITAQFTPTIKALLVLLIVYTAKDSKGIASSKMNGIMWPYKPDESASNNRNVYINKLRNLLEPVGDIRIVNTNRMWSIEFGEGTICDYIEASGLIGGEVSNANINLLLELLLRGPMLPNMELDWLDMFKAQFSESTIDFLRRQLDRKDLPEKVIVKAADTIFLHDYLNEDALRAKCRVFYAQGKAGLAKNLYDSFCKEYKDSIGLPFSVSLKDLIGG